MISSFTSQSTIFLHFAELRQGICDRHVLEPLVVDFVNIYSHAYTHTYIGICVRPRKAQSRNNILCFCMQHSVACRTQMHDLQHPSERTLTHMKSSTTSVFQSVRARTAYAAQEPIRRPATPSAHGVLVYQAFKDFQAEK
jgi:hypothetical protein